MAQADNDKILNQISKNQTNHWKSISEGNRTIFADGDSWFDYVYGIKPRVDIIKCLRWSPQYKYENTIICDDARPGDTLEHIMTDDFALMTKRIKQIKPPIFMLSGSGNDVGNHFDAFINPRSSQLPILRQEYLDQVIKVFREYYEKLIQMVAKASPETNIITHGYACPRASGIGFDGAIGPWFKPVFKNKGWIIKNNQEEQDQMDMVLKTLIDALNELQADLAKQNPKFHHVDLRKVITSPADWENELHLTPVAFERAAGEFHKVIQAIFKANSAQ